MVEEEEEEEDGRWRKAIGGVILEKVVAVMAVLV